jgi:hypothetical protein
MVATLSAPPGFEQVAVKCVEAVVVEGVPDKLPVWVAAFQFQVTPGIGLTALGTMVVQ